MLPTITYPAELPVSGMRQEIARAISDNQVVIVAGATGSGKTTQLPKICLELGQISIGHTQPRRLAARTIAERVAEELGSELGQLVGYQVRFTDRVSENTRIKLMTDGILLNEIHRDRQLRRYDTIIIDEAHERSLNIDFLLGYLKQLLPRRPDLKVIVTSATIDPESFARHFADADGKPAPIVEVSGRTYPVEIRYRPLIGEAGDDDEDDGATRDDRDYLTGILDGLDELDREERGDVLVFLSGENEIRDAADAVRGRFADRAAGYGATEVLPLYGRLSAADQHRVFERSRAPGIRRRIVLATNVAETSLTVPGIRYVIDAGTARISRYSARSKVQRLPIEAISQASANQRSGRSGRTSAGIAIRLYSEEDFERRPTFTDPEVLRTNLAAVILQMASLGLGAIEDFPFLTPPDTRGIRDGLDLLRELGALRSGAPASLELTRIGKQLARMPIEPRFGRMVIESKTQGVSREVLAIVAGLTIQDPRERPLDKRAQADTMHARFADPTSDFLTLVNLWNHLEQQQRDLGSSAFRRMCRAEFLNYLRVREWQDLYRQLVRLSKPLGLTILPSRDGAPAPNPDGIHRALLAGLLSHLGLRDDSRGRTAQASGQRSREGTAPPRRNSEYLGARGTRFALFPGSTLAKKPPAAVMSAELVETSRLFARTNAAIDPVWAEPLAGDLVKREYGEPRWEQRQGSAVADERVTLFGVPIVPRRRVQLGRIDAPLARELFLRHALVQGEWSTDRLNRRLFAFVRANQALRRDLEEVEERTRRRDIIVDDEAVFAFYDARVPDDVTDTRAFERWWRDAHRSTPSLLTLTSNDLLTDAAPAADADDYPDEWRHGDQRLTVTYRFEPGTDDDGVTVIVPIELLPRLTPSGFDWQVPGLRVELVTALLRTLPKTLRRSLVPAAEWATRIAAELPTAPTDGLADPFPVTVASIAKRLTFAPVEASDFDVERLPPHLRVTFRVIDARGRTLASGKHLDRLQRALAERTREAVAEAVTAPRNTDRSDRGRTSESSTAAQPPYAERTGLTTWDIGDLPRHVDTRRAGSVIRAYPALVDDGASVSLRLLPTEHDQALAHPLGIRRLLMLSVPSPAAYILEHLSNAEKLSLAASAYPSTKAILEDCLAAVVDVHVRGRDADGMLFSAAEFNAARDAVSGAVVQAMFDTVSLVAGILRTARDIDQALKGASSVALLAPLTDARSQHTALVHAGFISSTGLDRLQHLPRYLAGIGVRIRRLTENPSRDRVAMNELQAALDAYAEAGGTIPLRGDAPARLVRARWLIEELRISLFAQELRAAEPVSVQRIRKALAV